MCWLFRKTFWKEIPFPFFPSSPSSPHFWLSVRPFSLFPFLNLWPCLTPSLPLPHQPHQLSSCFLSTSLAPPPPPPPPRSLVYQGAFVLVGKLSNLIKVRDAIPGLVCPACWPCSLINSQGIRCAVLLCLSFFPSCPTPSSILQVHRAGKTCCSGWGDQAAPKYAGAGLLDGLISAFLEVNMQQLLETL